MNPCYLGIDIGGTKTAVSIGSPEEGIMEKTVFPTRPERGPQAAVKEMIALGQRFLQPSASHPQPARIGISIGAMFNPAEGCFGEAPHLPGWTGFPIVAEVESGLALPVAADNDANACALAEWHFGAAEGLRHIAFLTFGTGLGAGLILDGRLYRGATNLAGEIGAMRVAEDGPPVRGKPGCLEGFASGAGIAALAEAELGSFAASSPTCLKSGASTLDVAKGARSGDALCQQILCQAGTRLGEGLGILIDLLNLEMVVIGSIFARCEQFLRAPMETALSREAMPATRSACRIVPSRLGEHIGDFAAMTLAMGTTASKTA
jgi:glucokinase